MDEGSLEAAIEAYRAQLQQVDSALGAGLDEAAQADLLKLREDLQQLIELTESSLVSVKKSQLLASLEGASAEQPFTKETDQERATLGNPLDDEFAAFYSEVAGVSGGSNEHVQNSTADEEEDEEDINGTKVRAPYHSSWGTLEYHNAMVVCTEPPEDDEARVRVLYLHPTHKSMKPCQFYLEGKCRFLDNCKFSHGEVVRVSELRDFLEADFSSLEVGSSCLARHDDGLWYPARIWDIDSGFYTVKFDSLLLKEAVLEADGVIPPMRQEKEEEEELSSGSEEEEAELCDAGYAKVVSACGEAEGGASSGGVLGAWEAHTRGMGSKLLLKMGYEHGKGLGKCLEGRVEPVQAVVLPKGSSLDQCAELTHRKTQAAIAKDGRTGNGTGTGRKAKRKRAAPRPARPDVFDFLNSKIGDAAPSASDPSGKAGAKVTIRSLNVQLFETTEKAAQTEREIQRLTESLSKRNGRDAAVIGRLEERLDASRRVLQQLRAHEQHLLRQQNTAHTNRKMTKF